jgi:ribosome assembly protein 4
VPKNLKLLNLFHNIFLLIQSSDDEDEDDILDVPYLFFLNGHEIQTSIAECAKHQLLNTEKTLPIIYQPQAVFKVRPVSRCTSSMPGHTKEVLVASFSTSGRFLGKYSELTILEKSQIANSST